MNLHEIITDTERVTQIFITEIKQELETVVENISYLKNTPDEVTAIKLFVCHSKLEYLSELINELEKNLTK